MKRSRWTGSTDAKRGLMKTSARNEGPPTAPRTGAKLYQQIASQIAKAIAEGRYGPGSRLPAERDLADEFGVSRPTIREAMIALEIRGLVGARQGSGIYVNAAGAEPPQAGPDLDVGAFELMEARILFEGEAAALAAQSIDPSQLSELYTMVEQMERSDRTSEAFDADRRFHLAIARATANSLIVSTVEMLWNVREGSPLCAHMFAQAHSGGVAPRASEHRAIVEALASRQPHRAREAMRGHLKRVVDDLLEVTRLDMIRKAQADFTSHREQLQARMAL
ncbi:FadR/GntR family transcriptional regulator [Caulobacter sp. 73W]|uniref:FadR/GntR family transcriptional regulator n=1 Tax=Caulobacter sp. 73W TaxID=3161137 RepID=A0AB39KYZ6_9CAUL